MALDKGVFLGVKNCATCPGFAEVSALMKEAWHCPRCPSSLFVYIVFFNKGNYMYDFENYLNKSLTVFDPRHLKNKATKRVALKGLTRTSPTFAWHIHAIRQRHSQAVPTPRMVITRSHARLPNWASLTLTGSSFVKAVQSQADHNLAMSGSCDAALI